MNEPIDKLLATAKDAVRVYADEIRAAFLKPMARSHKADTTIVTKTDLAVERAMRALITERHPSLLIAREAGAVGVDFAGKTWQPGGNELIVAHPDLARQLVTALGKQEKSHD